MEYSQEILETADPIKKNIEEGLVENFSDIEKEAREKFEEVTQKLLTTMKIREKNPVAFRLAEEKLRDDRKPARCPFS